MSDSVTEIIHKGMDEAFKIGRQTGFLYGMIVGIIVMLAVPLVIFQLEGIEFTIVHNGKVVDRSVCPE